MAQLNDKKLSKLSRVELLELLVEQGEQLERTQKELAVMTNRAACQEKIARLAESAISRLSGVLEASELVLTNYTQNLQELKAQMGVTNESVPEEAASNNAMAVDEALNASQASASAPQSFEYSAQAQYPSSGNGDATAYGSNVPGAYGSGSEGYANGNAYTSAESSYESASDGSYATFAAAAYASNNGNGTGYSADNGSAYGTGYGAASDGTYGTGSDGYGDADNGYEGTDSNIFQPGAVYSAYSNSGVTPAVSAFQDWNTAYQAMYAAERTGEASSDGAQDDPYGQYASSYYQSVQYANASPYAQNAYGEYTIEDGGEQ